MGRYQDLTNWYYKKDLGILILGGIHEKGCFFSDDST